MPHDREELLGLIEDRLSIASRWLSARRDAADRHLEPVRARLDFTRRELRVDVARSIRHALARVHAKLEDLDRELDVPPAPATIRREELDAMRRHVRLTATLLPHVSNLDDPGWRSAREEYERSWEEIHLAMERGAAPSR